MKLLLLALFASLSLSAFAGVNLDLIDDNAATVESFHHGHGHHHPGHPPKKPLRLYKCTAVDSRNGRFSMTSNIWRGLDEKAYELCLDYSHAPRTCRVKECYRIK